MQGLRRYSETAQSVPDCCEVSARQVHPGWRRTEPEDGEWSSSPSNLFHPNLATPTPTPVLKSDPSPWALRAYD